MSTAEIAALEAAGRGRLLELWAELMDGPPPPRLSTPLMRRILGFEIQARARGGLDAATCKELARLRTGKVRPRTPGLAPGARLAREWNGTTHLVEVVEDGFLWRDQRWRSLSAIAREITGARWSGPRFFGLAGRRAS